MLWPDGVEFDSIQTFALLCTSKISSIFQVAVSEMFDLYNYKCLAQRYSKTKFEYMRLNMNHNHISRTLYTNICDDIMLVYLWEKVFQCYFWRLQPRGSFKKAQTTEVWNPDIYIYNWI